jgi:hypothetical protein
MATTYVLLNEYIPEIKFKGKLLNSDVVIVGETVTFDASDSNFCSDYAGIIHGFYNFPKNHAEGVTGYPKYFYDYRDGENKVCSEHAVDPDPSNVSYVTLSGYDPLASDEDNLPYVALRVANGEFMLPVGESGTIPVDCIYPSEIVFDFKVEAFGDQDIPGICAMADFFCTQNLWIETYANTMMVAKRDNGKTVITTNSDLPATGDYISGFSMASTQELDIDWSQWHRIRITYDYTKAFTNADGETVQGRNCTYFRLYIDDVFIPFIYTGLPGEWCDSNDVLEDGSIFPSDAASTVPYYHYCGFASYVPENSENSAVLYKNFRINRYVGQGTTLNADWYKRNYYGYQWLYLDTGISINHEIDAGIYPNAETNTYRTTVYNQWGSSNTIDYTEQCIVPPTVSMNYVLQSTEIPVTVTGDTEIELTGTDIVTLNAVTTSGMTYINAQTFYPWESDASTHSGDSFTNLGDLNNPNYQSMIDYSDGWLQLNSYTGRGPDARFGSNYYDFETLEGFFRITTEDVNAMLQETGADNRFYIPLIMFGVFDQYSNHRCYVCYNPKVNLDNDKSIATFGKKTEGTFSICRFGGADFKQCYFTFPKLEDTDIYHIALCYRVNDNRMCFVFINGICVFSAKFDDKVLDYAYQKAVLGTNSSGVDWIPVTLAMRSIRESLVKVYDVNFDMKGCFTFEDYPNGYAVSDDYYAFVGNQLAQRKYFDPAVLYPENKLTYQVLDTGTKNEWYLTLPDSDPVKISDEDSTRVAINRNSVYTLESQDKAGGKKVKLSLDFTINVPPTAVITTDSLSVYKGQYVVLSGENSFDEITSYQWSDGSTGTQTGFFAEADTTVSLVVTNPYGSDTAVVTIKVVELPVIEDVAGEYRVITVQQIPVDPVPYQEFAVILNGQNCFITLRQMGDFIYMSLRVDNTVIYNNLICDVNRVINIYPDANFSGKFFFVDTKGKVKPEYSGLNSRWLLYYSEDY